MSNRTRNPPPPPDFPRPKDQRRIRFTRTEDLDNPEFVRVNRQSQVEEAGKLWAACAARRSRRERELAAILSQRNRNNTVLVMTLNRGFTELLHNWILSCDLHGIEVRSWTLIVALDQETAAFFEKLGFAVYCDEISYGSQSNDAAGQYGDRTFVIMMFPKTAVVLAFFFYATRHRAGNSGSRSTTISTRCFGLGDSKRW